jgi:hypothetical protein
MKRTSTPAASETHDGAAASRRAAIVAALAHLDRLLEIACDEAEKAFGSKADTDPYRGFYVTPQDFRRLIGHPPGAPMFQVDSIDPNHASPFAELQQAFGLSAFDLDVLVIAVAVEIDLRYQRLFAYLQDDVTRKRPSVDLALNLLCPDADSKLRARRRFAADAPLFRNRLVQISTSQTGTVPFLARDLEVDEAVVSAMTGDPLIDRRLQPFTACLVPGAVQASDGHTEALARLVDRARANGQPALFHFRGPRHAGQQPAAAALAARLGQSIVIADCQLIAGADLDPGSVAALLIRDARLHNAVLCVDGIDALKTPELEPKLTALLASLRYALDTVVVIGDTPWAGSSDGPSIDAITVDFTPADFAARLETWRTALGADTPNLQGEPDACESLASRFRLTAPQIRAAVAWARGQAKLRAAADHDAAATLTADDLFAAARGQSRHRLGALARQICPRFLVGDLILPADAIAQLQEVCSQVRHRHVVYEHWGFDRKLSLGKGINVLFSGPPGVGKTMAAEVFANELGLDLFKIDLSQIVSKYIGETEKNLNRVFDEARASNAILFFDEADALFGKRSEVRDSHDRYANIEIAYLLQKMDEYEGLSVLATNLKQNLDEAFARRLSFIIDFPFPDEESRLRIWRAMWPADVPLSDDVDLAYVARTFRMSGGSIKNVAVAAAFLAAGRGTTVQTVDLVRATRREFQKMGKMMPYGEPGAMPDLPAHLARTRALSS